MKTHIPESKSALASAIEMWLAASSLGGSGAGVGGAGGLLRLRGAISKKVLSSSSVMSRAGFFTRKMSAEHTGQVQRLKSMAEKSTGCVQEHLRLAPPRQTFPIWFQIFPPNLRAQQHHNRPPPLPLPHTHLNASARPS